MSVDEREHRLNEWPRTLAKLQLLQSYCREMKKIAGSMQLVMEMLEEKPAFPTQAEEQLQKVEQDFALIHSFIKACVESYRNLPETA